MDANIDPSERARLTRARRVIAELPTFAARGDRLFTIILNCGPRLPSHIAYGIATLMEAAGLEPELASFTEDVVRAVVLAAWPTFVDLSLHSGWPSDRRWQAIAKYAESRIDLHRFKTYGATWKTR